MGIIVAALATAAALVGVTPEAGHLVMRAPDSNGPTTASQTSARLNALAEALRSNSQSASRLGIFDIAWPSSTSEYEAVGRNGILQVTVVVADRGELPVRTTYVHNESGNVPLVLLGVHDAVVPRRASVRSVGAFREDRYYLLPIALARQSGSILLDFAQHRNGFKLGDLPLEPPSYPNPASDAHPPEQQAIKDFLKREFVEAPAIGGP